MATSTFDKDGPYAGDGSANQAFAINFDFFDTSEIVATTRVIATGEPGTLVETTDYTISTVGSNPFTSGTLTLATGVTIASTSTLTISRNVPKNQQTEFETAGQFPSASAESQLDKLAMQVQDLQEQLNRCIKVPITDGSAQELATELANAIDRQDTTLVFSSDGSVSIGSALVPSETTVSAFGESLIDDASAAAARATLGLVLGTDVQAYNALLLAIAGLTGADNKIIQFTSASAAKVLDYLDEDAMGSDSAEAVASQQSIKAYVDGKGWVNGADTTYEWTLGDFTLDETWNTLDVSSYVPAGTKAACFNVVGNADAVDKTAIFRDGDSTNDTLSGRIVSQIAGVSMSNTFVIPIGSSREVLYWGSTGTFTVFSLKVVGYFL